MLLQYMLWRARVAAIVALALAIVLVFGLAFLVSSSREYVYRLALILQTAGILALTPVMASRVRVRPMHPSLLIPPARSNSTRREREELSSSNPTSSEFFTFYHRYNQPILIGNTMASLFLMVLLFAWALFGQTWGLPYEWLMRALLAFLGFAWLNLYMIALMFLLTGQDVPTFAMVWFVMADVAMSLLALPFSGLAYIVFVWFPALLRFAFRNGIRRVALIVTLPCLVVGLLFELFATFL